MTRRRKWAAIPGLALIAVTATVLSAYSGAQQGAAQQGAAAQAGDGPQPTAPQVVTDTAQARAQRDTNPMGGPWGYSGASSNQGYAPEQPIAFPHPQHVQTLGMNCLYCHSAANKSPDPGLPPTATCMGCHLLVAAQRPEIQKLQQYAKDSVPIPWVRIHKVPDYVQFPHMRHVNAGVTCQSCHGQVNNMARVYQASSLNMGWCVNCHVNGYNAAEGHRLAGAPDSVIQAAAAVPARKARYDCAICHY